MSVIDRRFSVAPMMDWTDRHCRYFLRLISGHALLYTEMIPAAAIVHGDTTRLLGFDPFEQPVALQIGGSDPGLLHEASRSGAAAGYIELNLNVGCPSERVSTGRFGACLFLEPGTVAACVTAMREASDCPVTVKTRVGVDNCDSDQALLDFVGTVAEAGCRTFIVHARKAWLSGLSPKENRTIPALNYDRVRRLKAAYPDLEIVVNGGIDAISEVRNHLATVDGVMLGRSAYRNPYLLATVDQAFFGSTTPVPSRETIVEAMIGYARRETAAGTPLHSITRHMLGLYHRRPGARRWRRALSAGAARTNAHGPELLRDALGAVTGQMDASAENVPKKQVGLNN